MGWWFTTVALGLRILISGVILLVASHRDLAFLLHQMVILLLWSQSSGYSLISSPWILSNTTKVLILSSLLKSLKHLEQFLHHCGYSDHQTMYQKTNHQPMQLKLNHHPCTKSQITNPCTKSQITNPCTKSQITKPCTKSQITTLAPRVK